MSENLKDWPNCARGVHLLGGLRAICNPDKGVQIGPRLQGRENMRFEIQKYGDLSRALQSLGFRPVGIDYVTQSNQISGDYPPEWRIASSLDHDDERGHKETSEMPWSHICANRNHSDNYLRNLCGRIAFSIDSCKYRLREISEAFACELITKMKEDHDEDPSGLFGTLNTPRVVFSIHAFFSDACMLRDRLAEFIARYVFNESEGESRISQFSVLRKRILKNKKDSDSLASELYTISEQKDEIGWLGAVGIYRDYLTHVGPLTNFRHVPFMRLDKVRSTTGEDFPVLEFPMPDLEKVRSMDLQIISLHDVHLVRQNLIELKEGSRTEAFAFAFEALLGFLSLAKKLIPYSPVAPEIPRFTKDDIIGDFQIRETT